MVKNLYKHEFKAWLRIMSVIFGITLAMGGLLRFLQFFESDSVYYIILLGAAIFVFLMALLVSLSAPTVFGIVRFYRNLFTGEGYLSFTLPVTTANHLNVKVNTAVTFSLLSGLVCILSIMLATAGEVFAEICKAASYLIKQIPENISEHLVGYCIEFLSLLVISLFAEYLFLYTCVCIGQLFRKNRILAAVGVYFGFYVLSQIFNTVLSVILVILEESALLTWLYTAIEQHPYGAAHTMLCGSVVLIGLLATVYYLICHRIIRKKLNLE